MKSDPLKYIRYGFEAFGLWILLLVFSLLPAQAASNFGGWIGRSIGPRLAASRKARRNLENALPDLSEARKDEIIKGMWDNLGRLFAEYPHLETLSAEHTEIIGGEILQEAIDSPKGAVFFGGHLGNFDINAGAVFKQYNHAIGISYRAPNNPWSDKLLIKARTLNGRLKVYSKSRHGGKNMMTAIKNGGELGILIDQKYNQGIAMPFFGMDAMTNTFFVQLAQKYKCPLIPIRNRRLDGANFSLTFYDPIEVEGKSVEEVVAEAHSLLEGFIKETPEQWLWLHRRWSDGPKDKEQG